MTEYGRSPGSEPWHPQDPLYGDGGWEGQQAQSGQQSSYGGQPQHYPEQPQSQQPQQQYGDWGQGQQAAYGQAQQQYQYYDGQQHQGYTDQGHHGHQGQGQYGQQGQEQYGQQGYADPGWGNGAQGHGHGQPHGHGHGQAPYPGGQAGDPYGGQTGGYTGQQPDPYGASDPYGNAGGYPRPEPPASPRRAQPEREPEPRATDWDPGPDQGEQAFFAGGDDEDDSEEPDGRGGRGGRKGKAAKGGGQGVKGPKKGRSGVACLVVVLVLGGGVGGVGYFGYQFYQDRFGAAPDYAGEGTNTTVAVTIPKGATGYTIGQELKKAGVVKSVDAFVAAQANNADGDSIQPGTYTLKKQMSAASALELMLDPKSQNNLTVIEGERNIAVYAKIDKKLGLKKGTTEGVADKEWKSLGLPDWANDDKDIKDPLEGFLYPSTYPVNKDMKPKAVLKEMVDLSKAKYEEFGLEKKAASLDLDSPLQVLTVASLVQAEGFTKKDFEKVARVVYNRLKINNTETYGLLDFDSTVNYLRGESKLATGSVNQLRQLEDPYNTYKIKGLPPGPIDNPGEVAIEAALNPAKGNWYYFVSISEDKTLFAETNEEHNRNREKYLEEQKNGQ